MAINEDEGDIDMMSATLAKTLMPAKIGIKNPFRDKGAKPPAIVPDATPNPAVQLPPMPTPMPYYQLPPQYYGSYNASYHQPGYPPPLHASVAVPASPKRPRQRSSSLPSEFNSYTDKLTDYMDWLIKRYPTKSEQLTTCLEILKVKDIVFETVESIDRDCWEAWGMLDGISLMLKSHQGKWECAEAKRHG